MQAGGIATQSVDILLKDAFLLCGSTRKTLPPHLLGVNERFKTLPAHGTLGAHKTRPAHHSRASTNVALIILRAVDLAWRVRSFVTNPHEECGLGPPA